MIHKALNAPLIQAIRPANLLIIAFVLYIVQYHVITPVVEQMFLDHVEFVWLVMFTVFCAIGGYLINDLHDVHMDRINKSGQNIFESRVSKRTGYIFYLVSVLAALGCAVLLLPSFGTLILVIFLICTGGLYWYAFRLKMRPLMGNMLISAFCAFVVFLPWAPYQNEGLSSAYIDAFSLINAFAAFAFLTTIIREIIKDVEDMRGDVMSGARTLPVIVGIRSTAHFIVALCMLLAAGLLYWQWMIRNDLETLSIVYLNVFILLPVLYVILKSLQLRSLSDPDLLKSQASRISNVMKVVMLTGSLFLIIL